MDFRSVKPMPAFKVLTSFRQCKIWLLFNIMNDTKSCITNGVHDFILNWPSYSHLNKMTDFRFCPQIRLSGSHFDVSRRFRMFRHKGEFVHLDLKKTRVCMNELSELLWHFIPFLTARIALNFKKLRSAEYAKNADFVVKAKNNSIFN